MNIIKSIGLGIVNIVALIAVIGLNLLFAAIGLGLTLVVLVWLISLFS